MSTLNLHRDRNTFTPLKFSKLNVNTFTKFINILVWLLIQNQSNLKCIWQNIWNSSSFFTDASVFNVVDLSKALSVNVNIFGFIHAILTCTRFEHFHATWWSRLEMNIIQLLISIYILPPKEYTTFDRQFDINIFHFYQTILPPIWNHLSMNTLIFEPK